MKNILTIALFFICAKSFAVEGDPRETNNTQDTLNISHEDDPNASIDTIDSNRNPSVGYHDYNDNNDDYIHDDTDDEQQEQPLPIYAPPSPQQRETFFAAMTQQAIAAEYENPAAHTENTMTYIENQLRDNHAFRRGILDDFTILERSTNRGEEFQQRSWMVYFIRITLRLRYRNVLELGLRGIPVGTHIAIGELFANDVNTGRVTLDIFPNNIQRLFPIYNAIAYGIEFLRRAGLPVTQAQQAQMADRFMDDFRVGRVQITLDRTLEDIFTAYYRDLLQLQILSLRGGFGGSGSFF